MARQIGTAILVEGDDGREVVELRLRAESNPDDDGPQIIGDALIHLPLAEVHRRGWRLDGKPAKGHEVAVLAIEIDEVG